MAVYNYQNFDGPYQNLDDEHVNFKMVQDEDGEMIAVDKDDERYQDVPAQDESDETHMDSDDASHDVSNQDIEGMDGLEPVESSDENTLEDDSIHESNVDVEGSTASVDDPADDASLASPENEMDSENLEDEQADVSMDDAKEFDDFSTDNIPEEDDSDSLDVEEMNVDEEVPKDSTDFIKDSEDSEDNVSVVGQQDATSETQKEDDDSDEADFEDLTIENPDVSINEKDIDSDESSKGSKEDNPDSESMLDDSNAASLEEQESVEHLDGNHDVVDDEESVEMNFIATNIDDDLAAIHEGTGIFEGKQVITTHIQIGIVIVLVIIVFAKKSKRGKELIAWQSQGYQAIPDTL